MRNGWTTMDTVMFVAVLSIVGVILYGDWVNRTKEPEPQKPWTDQEQLCADLLASTEHGDQYTERERLRMCRVYIDVNGGFE